MSHFIELQQRIKTIETIKKTTGAMRLISMSTHSRLRHQKAALETYSNQVAELLTELTAQEDLEAEPSQQGSGTAITLVIGSQKGLCGSFNHHLFHFFNEHQPAVGSPIITVGKYATDYIKSIGMVPLASFNEFTLMNYTTIASQISNVLFAHNAQQISAFSNYSKTFFIQKSDNVIFNFPPQELTTEPSTKTYLTTLRTKTALTRILYESLLAEQAARFLSMDSAYRNAEDILTVTKLAYNKARQAHVTRELMELAGGALTLDY